MSNLKHIAKHSDFKGIAIFSFILNVFLILLIYQGSVKIESVQAWINPSIISTLIGGLGGALAGTWISGNNANKQWNIQKELELNTIKKNYNLIMSELLFPVVIKKSTKLLEGYKEYPNLNVVSTVYGEERLGFSEADANEIRKLFSEVEEDVWEMFEEIDLLMNQSDELARSGNVDWDTYRMINLHKMYKRYIKEYKQKIEIIESTHLTKEQLEQFISLTSVPSQIESVRKILKAYDDIVPYQELFMIAYRNIISLRKTIRRKLN